MDSYSGMLADVTVENLWRLNPARLLTAEERQELGQLLRDEASYRDVNKMRRALNLVKQRYENMLSEGDPQNIRVTVESALRSLDATIHKLEQQATAPAGSGNSPVSAAEPKN